MHPGLLRNLAAGATSLAGALFWTKAVAHLARSGVLPSRQARKLSHITTAPFFMLTWPLYSAHPYARLIAAAVPFSFAARIALNPSGDKLAAATVRSSTKSTLDIAREGRSLAAYAASVAVLTAVGWRSSAPVYLAVAALCFGDGSADVIGTAVRGPALPLPRAVFSKRKTLPGTAAFAVATVVGGAAMIRGATATGFLTTLVPWHVLGKVAVASAAVELFPVEDNVTVPLVAFVVARTLLAQ